MNHQNLERKWRVSEILLFCIAIVSTLAHISVQVDNQGFHPNNLTLGGDSTFFDYTVEWLPFNIPYWNVIEVDGPNSTTPVVGGFTSGPNSTTPYFFFDFASELENQTIYYAIPGKVYFISQYGDPRVFRGSIELLPAGTLPVFNPPPYGETTEPTKNIVIIVKSAAQTIAGPLAVLVCVLALL